MVSTYKSDHSVRTIGEPRSCSGPLYRINGINVLPIQRAKAIRYGYGSFATTTLIGAKELVTTTLISVPEDCPVVQISELAAN